MSDTGHDTYGTVAKYYDRVLDPLSAPLRSVAMRLQPAGEGVSVLDVGCGTGGLLAAYADTGADCSGIDLSEAMLEQAAAKVGDRAELTLGSATDMPYADNSFDLVVASLFLHELGPDARSEVLSEMSRVVKPDSRVMVIDYRVGSLRWKGKAWRCFSFATERMAGAAHYRGWRSYLNGGGLPTSLPPTLDISIEKIVAGGNLSLWLLAPHSESG